VEEMASPDSIKISHTDTAIAYRSEELPNNMDVIFGVYILLNYSIRK
jgi:hypothetical protein